MSRENDIGGAPAGDAELLMMELLYGELDGAAAVSARGRIEKDAARAGELSAFEGLRALMRDLPDEEPPSAITAQLLHAAAVAAPSSSPAVAASAAAGGFFAWLRDLFRPVMMHPAMAAAATFILVAGVAGALYMSGEVDEVSRPRAPSASVPPAEASGSESTAAASEVADKGIARPSGGFNEDIVVSGEIEETDREQADPNAGAQQSRPGRRPATRSPRPRPKRPIGSGGSGADFSGRLEADKATRRGPRLPKSSDRRENRKTDKAATSSPTDDADSPAGNRPAKAKPVPRPTVTGTAGDSILVEPAQPEPELKTLDEKAPQRRDSPARQAANLHKKAQRAAQDRECDAVRSLGRRIHEIDSKYYSTTYLRDKRLAPCLRKRPAAKKKK